jgi:hypothetical protein
VYTAVRSIKAFTPWIRRIQHVVATGLLRRAVASVPEEWLDGETSRALDDASDVLTRRSSVLAELVRSRLVDCHDLFRNYKP